MSAEGHLQSYKEWEAAASIREAPIAGLLWNVTAYRLALYIIELGWADVNQLSARPLTRAIASQLYRALGSIAANLAEGLSRSARPDRARLFEYARSSARECCVWYRAATPILRPELVQLRRALLVQICKLLLTTIRAERSKARVS